MSMRGVAASLRTFEQVFTLQGRAGEIITDGYVEQTYDTDLTFKGVLVPAPASDQLEAAISGISTEGLSRLHVRLSQSSLPLPEVNDIVLDSDGAEWVILTKMDYEDNAETQIFLVGRKT